MKKVNAQTLNEAANRTMLKLSNEDMQVLLEDFDIVLKQLDLIGNIDGIDEVPPMSFPFDVYATELREDIPSTALSKEETLSNSKNISNGQIVIPKVL